MPKPDETDTSGRTDPVQIRDSIIAIIAAQALLDPQDIRPDSTLADLGLDSLGLVESIFAIEEAFDISIPFNANEPGASGLDLSSIDSIAAAVQGLIAQKAA